MSRIGKKEIAVPKNVKVKVTGQQIDVEGPKGKLSRIFPDEINISFENELFKLTKTEESISARQRYGLSRTLLSNMIIGVSEGFERHLDIKGVGYRSQVDGKNLVLNVGYSHPIIIEPPSDISFSVEKNTAVTVKGIDKEIVGLIASKIRSTRPPEPYKGKGVQYRGEKIRRKAGKAGK
uniref:Large ribosomal subunit protein uL6c n=1 Tax=Haptophyceae sp. NIES-3900 TaxID=2748608 RepID=A0A7R6WEM4_9EUKA|nr:ribosomal protein L6 [Haptophyceae sp. NIES-3900]